MRLCLERHCVRTQCFIHGMCFFVLTAVVPCFVWQDYCNMYLKAAGAASETGEPPKSVHVKSGDRWEIVVAVSDGQFQQVRELQG